MQTNKVIRTPDDMKGMKIRVPNSSMYINCLNAMGATPTAMGFSETISAVQQGVVDGLEGNMSAYSTNDSFESTMKMLEEEQGCAFNDVDVDAFRAVMGPEYQRMVKEGGVTDGFIAQIQELVAEFDAKS